MRPTKPVIAASFDSGAGPVPSSNPSISSFRRTLGGTLFMALISYGPATNGAHGLVSPGGYQRLFAFTGSLGHHRSPEGGTQHGSKHHNNRSCSGLCRRHDGAWRSRAEKDRGGERQSSDERGWDGLDDRLS